MVLCDCIFLPSTNNNKSYLLVPLDEYNQAERFASIMTAIKLLNYDKWPNALQNLVFMVLSTIFMFSFNDFGSKLTLHQAAVSFVLAIFWSFFTFYIVPTGLVISGVEIAAFYDVFGIIFLVWVLFISIFSTVITINAPNFTNKLFEQEDNDSNHQELVSFVGRYSIFSDTAVKTMEKAKKYGEIAASLDGYHTPILCCGLFFYLTTVVALCTMALTYFGGYNLNEWVADDEILVSAHGGVHAVNQTLYKHYHACNYKLWMDVNETTFMYTDCGFSSQDLAIETMGKDRINGVVLNLAKNISYIDHCVADLRFPMYCQVNAFGTPQFRGMVTWHYKFTINDTQSSKKSRKRRLNDTFLMCVNNQDYTYLVMKRSDVAFQNNVLICALLIVFGLVALNIHLLRQNVIYVNLIRRIATVDFKTSTQSVVP